MSWQVVSTLVVKDFILYFRNRFFALITGLALVAYGGIYYLLPATVDETLEIGLYAPDLPALFEQQLNQEGIVVHPKVSEQSLREAMLDGEFDVGVVLEPEVLQSLMGGEKEQIPVYFTPEFPEELQQVYALFMRELALALIGPPLTIETTEEILGPDMSGEQIPERERMLPLFAVFVLVMETMGLASLITSEVEAGTITALLVTPMRVEGLFLGKGIMGVGLAFAQGVLLMLITGGLDQRPFLIILALLVGAILVTGIGFLMASVGRDMMSVMGWGILALIVLTIPSFSVLFPGTISDWVKVVPSYYLVDTVHRAANFNVGWGELWSNLAMLTAFSAFFLCAGVFVLRRRFR
jgi:ABC-2 type transport system permease protein